METAEEVVLNVVHLLFLASGLLRFDYGVATVYWVGDNHCGVVKADGTEFKSTDNHIAHRTLPLGTKGYLCNPANNKCIKTVISDRGPYGAIRDCNESPITKVSSPISQITWNDKCYWWQAQTRLQKGWRYRGSFDITKKISKKLNHKSFGHLYFFYKDNK